MYRRLLTVFCLILFLTTLLVFPANAAKSGECGENATWTLSDSGVLTISGTGPMYDYIYTGYDPAFTERAPWRKDPSSVKKIVIEDGITRIGNNAFCLLEEVESVSIPNTVTSIGDAAFCGDKSLKSVNVPNSVTQMGASVFKECTGLKSATLSSGLEFVSGSTFYLCVSLTSIIIPEGVTSIGNNAFFCSGLTSVQLPESLQTIRPGAFYACELKQITIPANVKEIYYDAFSDCSSLKKVQFMGSAPFIDSRAFDCDVFTAYYPFDDASWTEEVRQDYSGTITWVAYCGKNHSWGAWQTKTEANCGKTGLKIRTCAQCGMKQEETVPVTGQHQYETVVTPPTCRDEGFTTHICTVCNHTYTDSVTPVGTHTYEDVVTAPTCTQEGFTTHTCTVCQHTKVDSYTEKVEHTFGEWSIVKSATCIEKGIRQRFCVNCNAQESEGTELSDHNYRDVVTPPTCTQKGFTTHTCTVCEHTVVDGDTEMTAHTYGEWIEAKAASRKETGERYRQCINCSEKQTEMIPQLPVNRLALAGMIVGGMAVVAAAVGLFAGFKKKQGKHN